MQGEHRARSSELFRKPEYIKVVKNSQLITYEYLPQYKAYIPMAAGFRTVTAREARKIAARLYKQHKQAPENETDLTSEVQKPRRECDVQRLILPTVASKVRQMLKGSEEKTLTGKEDTYVCDRLHLSPSQRYFPEAYVNWLDKNSCKWNIESRQNQAKSSNVRETGYKPIKHKFIYHV